MKEKTANLLREWAEEYNDLKYFQDDPIAFPREFLSRGASLQDIEIAAVFASHLAWGRRAMICRDCERRTVKWSEIAGICGRLREWYTWHDTLEVLSAKEIRSIIFRRKDDPKAPDKKINLMRRWMVRNDGKVDLGLWTDTSPAELLVPLDVHVHAQASALGLTSRRQKDIVTAQEITGKFKEIWPDDPMLGDFALFGYGVSHNG